MPKTPSILLVHGAAHGAWCWERVVPHLQRLGFHVDAIDLPGRAGGGRAGWRISLETFAKAVAARAQAANSPVVAVGHSMGGQVISAAAELAPAAFERLVYLSAFLPRHGDSVASLGAEDTDSDLARAVHASMLTGTVTINPQTCGPVFYGDCSAEDLDWARARLVPESLRPSITKIRLSDARFGRAPRSYIRCTQDRALSIQMQDRMIGRQRCERVVTLDASHSPFLSMPERLAHAIRTSVRGE